MGSRGLAPAPAALSVFLVFSAWFAQPWPSGRSPQGRLAVGADAPPRPEDGGEAALIREDKPTIAFGDGHK